MKSFKKLKLGCLLLALLLAPFSCAQGAWAEDDKPEYRIQVSPTSLDLDLKPGEKVETSFKVQNTGSKVLDYKLSTAPYSVKNENYSADFTTETDHTDIYKWVTFSQYNGSIEPGEQDVISVTVNVPNDIPAGGQYGVLLAQIVGGESSDSSGVEVSRQVGVLIYSENVDGETRKTGSVAENKIAGFLFAPPIQGTSVVENTGNVHADAVYTLEVFPLFSNEEVYTNVEHPDVRTILPDTKRVNTLTWDGSPQLGIFKVKQTVKFLGEENVTEKVVFICPIWFLFIILVLIFLIVFWIVSRARGRKE